MERLRGSNNAFLFVCLFSLLNMIKVLTGIFVVTSLLECKPSHVVRFESVWPLSAGISPIHG